MSVCVHLFLYLFRSLSLSRVLLPRYMGHGLRYALKWVSGEPGRRWKESERDGSEEKTVRPLHCEGLFHFNRWNCETSLSPRVRRDNYAGRLLLRVNFGSPGSPGFTTGSLVRQDLPFETLTLFQSSLVTILNLLLQILANWICIFFRPESTRRKFYGNFYHT